MTIQRFYVRPATPEDKDKTQQIAKLINDAYNSTETWSSTIDLVEGDRITDKELDNLIDSSGSPNTLLYAFDQDKPIGVVFVSQIKEEPEEALISMLSVSTDYQSQGIGSLLMKEAMEQTLRNGLKMSVIHVFKGRPELLKWYAKLGFKEVEEVDFRFPSILKVKGDKTRTVVMKK